MSVDKKAVKVSADNAESIALFITSEMLTIALAKAPDFEALIEAARLEIIGNQEYIDPKMQPIINKVAEITTDALRIINLSATQ